MTTDTHTRVAYDGVIANERPIFARLQLALARLAGRPVRRYHAHIVLRGADGAVKAERHYFNTVTTAGRDGIADQILAAPTLAVPTHMAVGTGTPTGTALGTELDRNALTSKTRSSATVTMVGDWAAGDATGSLTEAGTFDAAGGGNMWMSASFAVINKGADDSLTVSWTLEIS